MNIYKYLAFFIIFPIYAQNYEMKIINGVLVDQYNYEFETIISGEEEFELTSYQCVFSLFNLNNNDITFNYVEGSSDLSNSPSAGIGIINKSVEKYLTFASSPGIDVITTKKSVVGKFRISSTTPISNEIAIVWKFDDVVNTILTGTHFINITNPINHLTEMGNNIFLHINNVTASATTDNNTSPEKTFDGLGYNDGDSNARWAAQPLPQWIKYDFGTIRNINSSKISFFKFNENRIYTYSVSVSQDNNSWTEIVSNAQSSNSEWSINNFELVSARYIKIDIISATNNPDNWANIWEVEFRGSATTTTHENNKLPSEYTLYQNYPNPFNPSTKIRFSLVEEAFVSLTIYNQLGEKIEELVNDNLLADNYEVNFNAENLASGIYFYKLNVAGKYSSTKKMLLIK